ncbi:MAG: HutD family protein [Terrimesophilobacter sp.]
MSDETDQLPDSHHVIAWSTLTALPWRNGGGVTRQILSRRLGTNGGWVPASADDWDWRLSIADVDSAGPFSTFTGMTRILTVIEGKSVTLTVDGTVKEVERHRPFRFDGGENTSAELPHGPIRDLNLIARSGTVDAAVNLETLSGDQPRQVHDGQYCILLEGSAQLSWNTAGATGVTLGHYDTVVCDAAHPPIISGDGILAVITVSDCA